MTALTDTLTGADVVVLPEYDFATLFTGAENAGYRLTMVTGYSDPRTQGRPAYGIAADSLDMLAAGLIGLGAAVRAMSDFLPEDAGTLLDALADVQIDQNHNYPPSPGVDEGRYFAFFPRIVAPEDASGLEGDDD